ncbi:histidine triad (HIT) protein [Pseudopedobacter saltans DSM 12145]|uniref:Histidine triad (HIT) protein n=1 Tax=Pseudopedobacter saltans (strain ATCC 51119 / DSM 12145 / JCM 21818 / CCUG 39354 / LMG 10337 / NBRC 100064 / NCIMB 13643) TaxID=762903 RepID=F0SBZ3_PSESL|nr:HIT family protein [Pseudopedobacter saltans]ADY53834.1 histidine triad (HIT) protein [Pseudopedobacter saltans DSM 12145]
MASIFTKIVNGEIPAHKVAETSEFLAFLDINPLKEGHVLVIPKKEIDYIFDIEDELYVSMMIFAKIVAAGIKKAIPCNRVGVAVVGLEVPHAHIHLIPIDKISDMDFGKKKLTPTTEQLSETALKILDALREV